MNLRFNVSAEQVEIAKKFYETYDLVNSFIPAESNEATLKPKIQRKCRYCGRSMPDVKFTEAHLLPAFLGNKFLFSDFECEICNQLFSEYEDQFAKMLEPFRTLHAMQGRGNKFPTFKSPKEAVRMEVQDFYKQQTVQISRTDFENEVFSFDAESGLMTVKYRKHPYSLRKVYKLLIKLALSIIPEDEVESDYRYAKDYILNTFKGNLSGCIVTGYQLQFPVKFPTHLFLFKKRDLNAKTFTHVIALYTLNYIFFVPVTLNIKDIPLYSAEFKPIEFPMMTVQNIDFQNAWSCKFYDDFASEEPVTGKEEEMTFSIPKEDLAKLVAVNVETGEEIPGIEFGKEPIAKIIMGTGNELTIDIKNPR